MEAAATLLEAATEQKDNKEHSKAASGVFEISLPLEHHPCTTSLSVWQPSHDRDHHSHHLS